MLHRVAVFTVIVSIFTWFCFIYTADVPVNWLRFGDCILEDSNARRVHL